ncbi:hypothetical protein FB451DRAFT_315266 [Mycena latifolia]|nr:hypothetical protein FB451DRAFT_315266 [Mycena latifolia]
MSVAELQRHIDELEADIVCQKEVLKNLERSKSTVQRQLNSLLDPVTRLPLEISSEIFIQCLSSRPKPGRRHAPMLLLDICSAWTTIALSTPALWASIRADEALVNPTKLLDAWLKRAGSRALTISLPKKVTGDIAAAIRRRVHHLKELRIFHDEDDIDLVAAMGPFLSLQTLTFVGDDKNKYTEDIRATVKLLRVCPNLVICTLHSVSYGIDTEQHAEMLVLPCMKHLHLGTYGTKVLRHISLPSLQSLHCTPMLSFIALIKRSSPPLNKLSLGSTDFRTRWGAKDQLEECLSLLPQLTHLELVNFVQSPPNHLVTILADSPHLVPNLSNLLFESWSSFPAPWYEKLTNALFARRNKINIVQVMQHQESELRPSQETCAALRQLVADGMTIQIRTENNNYI